MIHGLSLLVFRWLSEWAKLLATAFLRKLFRLSALLAISSVVIVLSVDCLWPNGSTSPTPSPQGICLTIQGPHLAPWSRGCAPN
jgi:hypothetical protein